MMKMAIFLIVFTCLFAFSEVTQAAKHEETFRDIECQDDLLKDVSQDSSIVGTWNDQIFQCKEHPEYPGKATCSEHQVNKSGLQGLTTVTWDFTANMMKKAWSFTVAAIGKIWNGPKRMVEWFVNRVMWLAEWMYNGTSWLVELTWNGIVWLVERVKKQIEWLVEFTQKNFTWAFEKIWTGFWTGCKGLAEWAWKEAKLLAEWIWKAIERNCKPLAPALKYVLETVEVVTKLYNKYAHEHLKNIQARIIVSTWKDTGYTIASVFIMDCVAVAVYKLLSCPVMLIRRRWQDYKKRKDAEAARWRMPPKRSQPKKPVWQNPKKRKLYRNKTGYSKKFKSFSTKSTELLKSLSRWLLVICFMYVLNRFVV